MSSEIFEELQTSIINGVGIQENTFDYINCMIDDTYIPLPFTAIGNTDINSDNSNVAFSRYLDFLETIYMSVLKKEDNEYFNIYSNRTSFKTNVINQKNKYNSKYIVCQTLPKEIQDYLNCYITENLYDFSKYYLIDDTYKQLNRTQKQILLEFFLDDSDNKFSKERLESCLNKIKSSQNDVSDDIYIDNTTFKDLVNISDRLTKTSNSISLSDIILDLEEDPISEIFSRIKTNLIESASIDQCVNGTEKLYPYIYKRDIISYLKGLINNKNKTDQEKFEMFTTVFNINIEFKNFIETQNETELVKKYFNFDKDNLIDIFNVFQDNISDKIKDISNFIKNTLASHNGDLYVWTIIYELEQNLKILENLMHPESLFGLIKPDGTNTSHPGSEIPKKLNGLEIKNIVINHKSITFIYYITNFISKVHQELVEYEDADHYNIIDVPKDNMNENDILLNNIRLPQDFTLDSFIGKYKTKYLLDIYDKINTLTNGIYTENLHERLGYFTYLRKVGRSDICDSKIHKILNKNNNNMRYLNPKGENLFTNGIPYNHFLLLIKDPFIKSYFVNNYFIFFRYKDNDNFYNCLFDQYCGNTEDIISVSLFPKLVNNTTTFTSFIKNIRSCYKEKPQQYAKNCLKSNNNSQQIVNYNLNVGLSMEGIRFLNNMLKKIESPLLVVAAYIYCFKEYPSNEEFDVQFEVDIDTLFNNLVLKLNIPYSTKTNGKCQYSTIDKNSLFRKYKLNDYLNQNCSAINKLFDFINNFIKLLNMHEKQTGGYDNIINSNLFDNNNFEQQEYEFREKLKELYNNEDFTPENISKIIPIFAYDQQKIFNNVSKLILEKCKKEKDLLGPNKVNGGDTGGSYQDMLINDSILTCAADNVMKTEDIKEFLCDNVKLFREGFCKDDFIPNQPISSILMGSFNPLNNKDMHIKSLIADKNKLYRIGNDNNNLFNNHFRSIYDEVVQIKNRQFNIPPVLKESYLTMIQKMYELLNSLYVAGVYTHTYNSFTKLLSNKNINRFIAYDDPDKTIEISDDVICHVIKPCVGKIISDLQDNLLKSSKNVIDNFNNTSNCGSGEKLFQDDDINKIMNCIKTDIIC